ncbi:MAG TPA: ABC transporter permease [Myxococcota bacterium]|nr:ABC transporter permease [Myxococcota bacterium]
MAWRNLWRQSRRSMLTAVAMGLAVALCLASVALTEGIYATMGDALVTQSLGHVQLHHAEYPTTKQPWLTIEDEGLVDRISGLEEVEGVTARLYGQALLGNEEDSSGAILVGIEPGRELDIFPLDDKVVEGRFLAEDAALEVVLGEGLADDLDVGVGDQVVIITQATDGSLGNAALEIVGVVRSGRTTMDRSGAWLHLWDLQGVLALEGQVHEILVIGPDPEESGALLADIEDLGTGDLLVRTWQAASPSTAQMMAMQDVSTMIFLGIIFGVAALGVLNTMLMAVFERTRELGLMKALGLTPLRMVALVLTESALLALLSCVFGGALGGLLDWYLVTEGLDFGAGFDGMGVTFDPVIKGRVTLLGIAQVLSSLFVICVLASVWPAVRAARLRPVESMRSI